MIREPRSNSSICMLYKMRGRSSNLELFTPNLEAPLTRGVLVRDGTRPSVHTTMQCGLGPL